MKRSEGLRLFVSMLIAFAAGAAIGYIVPTVLGESTASIILAIFLAGIVGWCIGWLLSPWVMQYGKNKKV